MSESAASESTSDPPFSLYNIGINSGGNIVRKTIKHIAVNCRPPSIIQSAATIFNVEAAAAVPSGTL